MHNMCGITQFVVALVTEYITSFHLVRLFMDCLLLKSGLCAIIVVDSDCKFKDTFLVMV